MMRRCILSLFVFLFTHLSCYAEVYQLVPVERSEAETKFEVGSANQLVEKETGKKFVIEFVKADANSKFRMSSDKFKKAHKDPESIRKIFDKESYEKIDFQNVDLFDSEHLTIKAVVFWFAEGYEGVETFYFMLIKKDRTWVLDWLVH